jgi:hypothetical protein
VRRGYACLYGTRDMRFCPAGLSLESLLDYALAADLPQRLTLVRWIIESLCHWIIQPMDRRLRRRTP